jgi:hypothetical protein
MMAGVPAPAAEAVLIPAILLLNCRRRGLVAKWRPVEAYNRLLQVWSQ